MKKEILETGDVEKTPPFLIRNSFVANVVPYIVDWKMGGGLNSEGHRRLRKVIFRVLRGQKVSMTKDVSRIYEGADLSIEVDGHEHIPPFGPTIFIANHTRGGPLYSMGQFFEMVKAGHEVRSDIEDDYVREPFIIAQRGLAKGKILEYFTGMFYEFAGRSFNCEVVEIPRHDENGEVINKQNLKPRAIQRVVGGGAGLWIPQGTHRDPNDLRFPEKATGFLKKVSDEDRDIQLVPIRSMPDSQGNIKIVFGPPVGINHVVESGGINYFAEKHIAPLS